MRKGYGSCVCVCYRASYYIPRLYVENKVQLGILWCFQDMHCVDFIENALFKVLATFADHLCFLCFLMSSRSTKETAMASLQED